MGKIPSRIQLVGRVLMFRPAERLLLAATTKVVLLTSNLRRSRCPAQWDWARAGICLMILGSRRTTGRAPSSHARRKGKVIQEEA